MSSASGGAGAGAGGGMNAHYGNHTQGGRQAQGMYGAGQGSVPGQVSECCECCRVHGVEL